MKMSLPKPTSFDLKIACTNLPKASTTLSIYEIESNENVLLGKLHQVEKSTSPEYIGVVNVPRIVFSNSRMGTGRYLKVVVHEKGRNFKESQKTPNRKTHASKQETPEALCYCLLKLDEIIHHFENYVVSTQSDPSQTDPKENEKAQKFLTCNLINCIKSTSLEDRPTIRKRSKIKILISRGDLGALCLNLRGKNLKFVEAKSQTASKSKNAMLGLSNIINFSSSAYLVFSQDLEILKVGEKSKSFSGSGGKVLGILS